MISALELLLELSSFVTIPSEIKERATTSTISSATNPKFKRLVKDWSMGKYDEYPEYVVSEISYLLKK
jgi:hypothetical protein